MRKFVLERAKSSDIVAEEVSRCILSRLEKAGFKPRLKHNLGTFKSWDILVDELSCALLRAVPIRRIG